jgi:hypothetical protein
MPNMASTIGALRRRLKVCDTPNPTDNAPLLATVAALAWFVRIPIAKIRAIAGPQRSALPGLASDHFTDAMPGTRTRRGVRAVVLQVISLAGCKAFLGADVKHAGHDSNARTTGAAGPRRYPMSSVRFDLNQVLRCPGVPLEW